MLVMSSTERKCVCPSGSSMMTCGTSVEEKPVHKIRVLAQHGRILVAIGHADDEGLKRSGLQQGANAGFYGG